MLAPSKAGPEAAEVQRIRPVFSSVSGTKRQSSLFVPISASKSGAFTFDSQGRRVEASFFEPGMGKPAAIMEQTASAPIKAPMQGGM